MEKTIHWNIDAEEFAKVQLAAMGITDSGKRKDVIVCAVFEFILLLMIFILFQQPGFQWTSVIIPLLLALVGVPAYLFYRLWDLPRRVRKASGEQQSMLGEHTFTFTDDVFLFKGPYGESQLPWKLFVRWKEMGEYLFLFQSDRLVNYLPKTKLDAETLEFICGKIGKDTITAKPSALSRISRIAVAVLLTAGMLYFIVWWYLQAFPR